MKTIGLSMIVKNEAGVIIPCLRTLRPLIDYYLIVDTGSEDGTQQVILNYLEKENLNGEVVEETWQNFAYNRTSALDRLRKHRTIDYALVMDADDVLVFDDDFNPKAFKESLTDDFYRVHIRRGPIVYDRPLICRNGEPFSFRGVLHEFLESPPNATSGIARGFYVLTGYLGSRGRDRDHFLKDAEILEEALEKETDWFLRARYIFYLAQSYRDAGDLDKALDRYLERTKLGHWEEEVYQSYYQAARILDAQGRSFSTVMSPYNEAIKLCPLRGEALHGASRFCRLNRHYELAYKLARAGVVLAEPPVGLFIEPWIYDYGMLDEFSISAYWVGHYGESAKACEKLLANPRLPPEYRDRVKTNQQFALLATSS